MNLGITQALWKRFRIPIRFCFRKRTKQPVRAKRFLHPTGNRSGSRVSVLRAGRCFGGKNEWRDQSAGQACPRSPALLKKQLRRWENDCKSACHEISHYTMSIERESGTYLPSDLPYLEDSPAWIASKKSLFNMCKIFWNRYVGIINAGFYMKKTIYGISIIE